MPGSSAPMPQGPGAGRPAPRRGNRLPDGGGTSSLEKGLAVLEWLSTRPGGTGVSQLARDLGMPKGTVARLLLILSGQGYVWRERERPIYRLGARALELTANALDELLVVGHARPHLYDLAGRTGYVASLGLLWGAQVVLADVVEPPAAAPAALAHDNLTVGRGALAHCSSIGKAILAFRPPEDVSHFLSAHPLVRRTARTITAPEAFRSHLAAVHVQGWALNDGESTERGTSVAAPIFDHTGAALAAIAIEGTHVPGERPASESISAVAEAARRVSFHLGYHPRAFR